MITLVVIGIVVSMTIPVVITNYRKTQVEAKLKKFYSSMTNAIRLSETENGNSSDWPTNMNWNSKDELYVWFDKYIMKNVNLLTDCRQAKDKRCEIPLNSEYTNDNIAAIYIFSDGSYVNIIPGGGKTEGLERQFHLRYDINGNKSPNKQGKDIFSFRFVNGQINCDNHNTVTSTSVSQKTDRKKLIESCKQSPKTCTCLIMKDSWRIKKDYPIVL